MNAKRKCTAPEQVDDGRAFTIEEFCARNGDMSPGQFKQLQDRGLGPLIFNPPKTMIFLITSRAEREWHARMEKWAKSREAKLDRERRREQGGRAAARSLVGSSHISKLGGPNGAEYKARRAQLAEAAA
jgi:hypothetical protein